MKNAAKRFNQSVFPFVIETHDQEMLFCSLLRKRSETAIKIKIPGWIETLNFSSEPTPCFYNVNFFMVLCNLTFFQHVHQASLSGTRQKILLLKNVFAATNESLFTKPLL